ncbi:soluble lytic murein transglycosylase, partial [Anaerolinea thermolimosa]|uniref:lytic transglycosylase domain-containing protein n=1 Tax=Anaerolinea thermolimosa TaxID=229919 RepID=UPI0007838925
PTPTPTPLPAARLHLAEDALFLGDFEQALAQYQETYAEAKDAETRVAAATGIGRALFNLRNYPSAITWFTTAIEENAPNSDPSEAWYYLAEAQMIQQNYAAAAEAYAKYMELRPGLLDGYIQQWRGDALLAAGNAPAAIEAYRAALEASPPGDPSWIRIKLARAYAMAQDYTSAVTTYLDVYQTSSDDSARANANYLLGQLYLELGETEQAYARFTEAILRFPAASESYSGLVELVNAGIPVNDLDRGKVDYFAGQYGLGADALTRVIESGSAPAEAWFYRALCRRAMREYGNALEDFNVVIQNYQGDAVWSRAYSEKAFTLWAYLDQYQQAAETLLEYVRLAPDASDAPDRLYEAARIFERGGYLTRAAETWERVIDAYPSSSNAYRALFLTGITFYRLQNYSGARTIFQRALVLSSSPGDQAAAYLWIGKTHQAEGHPDLAQEAWRQAVQADPTGYYSERAAELLIGRPPFSILNPFDVGYDLNAERPTAEAWLKTTFNLPPETNLADLTSFMSSPAFLRAEELYRLGEYALARDEYETVRQQVLNDPVQTFRLMNHLLEKNFYRQAILSSRQILDLAGLDDAGTLSAPSYFNHIRFGIYFKDLILSAADAEQLNPLFLLSVIRQESLFEPFARSSASARGLLQIMPATGQELATQLNWPPGYTDRDLSRPVVSIRFGARYLARQRDYFNGDLVAALAAYNGGPGNTLQWVELSKGDPDLLLEVIRADETRRYIMNIFENFNIYRLVYERKP